LRAGNTGVTASGTFGSQVAATDFRILGSLEVVHEGRPVDVPGTRQRELLAILLLHAGEVVSTDRLIDDLWQSRPPEAGATALRVRVSQLRRALGPAGALLQTRSPGYVMALAPGQLDLWRFERLVDHGHRAFTGGDAAAAADDLREALALWRGPPLADFSYMSFAQGAIVRLDELRLTAIELRMDAELALGHHSRLTAELQALVRDNPLRERLWGHLMLALYRSGRQAEALGAYREARRRLVDEIGLEPGPALRELERRILAQDEGLAGAAADPTAAVAPAHPRAILVLARDDASVDALVTLAGPLALDAHQELLVAVLVQGEAELAARSACLRGVQADAAGRGLSARVVAFTTDAPAADALRLANETDVALLVLDAPAELLGDDAAPGELTELFEEAVCDVALVAGAGRRVAPAGAAVIVPFGGHQHDWAAAELGAWLARARGLRLQLTGTRADAAGGRRDASRLLGHASIALQRGMGITAEPRLIAPGTEGVIEAAADAAAVVVGLSDRFAREGLGAARVAIARRAPAPVLLVRRGLRPGGIAPARALTRFTWSAG
jgi:DNA-binding SARP family transcriptional activator